MAQLNLPSKQTWDGLAWLLYCSVFVVAAFLLYDAVFTIDYLLAAGRVRDYELQLRASLSATVGALVDEFGIPWDEVGVYHYQLSRLGRWRQLNRVGGMLAGIPPNDIQRAFTLGKGVPGLAVQKQMLLAEPWRQLVERWEQALPEEWERQDPIYRYGLSWGELMHSVRVEGIVANPLFSVTGRSVGCTVVTGPFKPQQLASSRMRRILSDTATQVKHLGPTPRGWRRHAR